MQMVPSMKDSSLMGRDTFQELGIIVMEILIVESMKMDKGMDTGYSIIKKVAFLKVNGKMTREMDLEKKLTKMDLNLKECM